MNWPDWWEWEKEKAMKEHYLEVTFRKGKPLAAYLYLHRQVEAKSTRTESVGPGLLVDYGVDGQPIGLEITAPGQVMVDQVNGVLAGLSLPLIEAEELAPLQAV